MPLPPNVAQVPNRTIVELKHEVNVSCLVSVPPFNRTIVELKQGFYCSFKKICVLLIEPLWN